MSRHRPAADVREGGQTLTELALVLALIAILAVLALVFVSAQITELLSSIGDAL